MAFTYQYAELTKDKGVFFKPTYRTFWRKPEVVAEMTFDEWHNYYNWRDLPAYQKGVFLGSIVKMPFLLGNFASFAQTGYLASHGLAVDPSMNAMTAAVQAFGDFTEREISAQNRFYKHSTRQITLDIANMAVITSAAGFAAGVVAGTLEKLIT